jgi:hypothetical protein
MDEYCPFSSMIYLSNMVIFDSYVQLPEGIIDVVNPMQEKYPRNQS